VTLVDTIRSGFCSSVTLPVSSVTVRGQLWDAAVVSVVAASESGSDERRLPVSDEVSR